MFGLNRGMKKISRLKEMCNHNNNCNIYECWVKLYKRNTDTHEIGDGRELYEVFISIGFGRVIVVWK